MITIPSKAVIGRIMPKEAFYNHLNLSREIRDNFVSDIKRIVMEYKFAPDTLNVESGKEISEILMLSIELKNKDMDYRIVESIASQNAHKMLFLLKFEEFGQLALYYKKLYKTGWIPLVDIKLNFNGLNVDSIWEGFIEQIALKEEVSNEEKSLTVDEKLKKQETILKLQKEIYKLEKISRSEKQPKKRFELFTRLQILRKKLDEEKGE